MVRRIVGTNNGHARRFNRRVVLETIRLFGPISRAEIARRTALMFPTVSGIVSEFVDQDIVRMVGRTTGGRGQPARLVALNGDAAFTFGVHLDRHQIRVVLVDLAGNVLARRLLWIDVSGAAETVDAVVSMTGALQDEAGVPRRRIIGAGLTLAGPLDRDTDLSAALSQPEWRGAPLRDELQQRLDMPVLVERDAPAAALGERLHGAGRSIGSFFSVIFSYGVGGGIVLAGQPYLGVNGYAGEIGHYPSVRDGRLCSCGARGCLETYVSMDALYRHLGIDGEPKRSAHRLDRLIVSHDPRLETWAERAADLLAPALMTVENLLDVDVVFLGGNLPETLALDLIGRMKPILASMRMSGKDRYPELRLATSGADAAALGAAVLPVFESLAPDPSMMLKRSVGTPGERPDLSVLQL